MIKIIVNLSSPLRSSISMSMTLMITKHIIKNNSLNSTQMQHQFENNNTPKLPEKKLFTCTRGFRAQLSNQHHHIITMLCANEIFKTRSFQVVDKSIVVDQLWYNNKTHKYTRFLIG